MVNCSFARVFVGEITGCQMSNVETEHQIKAPSITGHLLSDVVFNKKNPSGITFAVKLQTK